MFVCVVECERVYLHEGASVNWCRRERKRDRMSESACVSQNMSGYTCECVRERENLGWGGGVCVNICVYIVLYFIKFNFNWTQQSVCKRMYIS